MSIHENYGQKVPKKSSRLIRTLIERQNEKNTQISRNIDAPKSLNTDMQHFRLMKVVPEMSNKHQSKT